MTILNRPNSYGKIVDMDGRMDQAGRVLGAGHTLTRLVDGCRFTMDDCPMTPSRAALIREFIRAADA